MNTPHGQILRWMNTRPDAAYPDPSGWLSAAEQSEAAHWRNPVRRHEWLAGRWLVKSVIQRELHCGEPDAPAALPDVDVLSLKADGRSTRPQAIVAGRCLSWNLSLAHADGLVVTGISTDAQVRIGVDVVSTEATYDDRSDLWLTPREQEWIGRSAEPHWPARIWSLKEAVYKGTNRGEPLIPRRIEVLPDSRGEFTCSVRGGQLHNCRLRVLRHGRYWIALATLGPYRNESDS